MRLNRRKKATAGLKTPPENYRPKEILINSESAKKAEVYTTFRADVVYLSLTWLTRFMLMKAKRA